MRTNLPLTLCISAALALPGLTPAYAYGNEALPAAHPNMGEKSAGHAEQSRGHAAALGKPAATKDATRTIEIEMGDGMRFKPERIAVKRGETVHFVVRNVGQVKHEMVLGTLAELRKHAALMAKFPEMVHDDPNAISVEAGKIGEFAWTFTKAGRFDFACLVPGHFEAGMKGKIAVRK